MSQQRLQRLPESLVGALGCVTEVQQSVMRVFAIKPSEREEANEASFIVMPRLSMIVKTFLF